MLDRTARPMQFRGQAPRAVTRKLQRKLLDPGPQLAVLHRLLIRVRTGRHLQEPTQQPHRKVLPQPCDDFPSLREREESLLETFFEAASSIVNWPTSRSSSAMRSCSADCCCLLANTCGARSRKFCLKSRQQIGRDIVLPTDLRFCFLPFECLQDDLDLELRALGSIFAHLTLLCWISQVYHLG